MPKLVTYLGDTSFGLFSLTWVVLGYLAYLDVGVNRAATKFVSEHLSDGDEESTRSVVRTAILANLLLGVAGCAVVASFAPFLVHSLFKISPSLAGEAQTSFYLVAFAVPVLLVHGVLRAVLSSYQQFGWINAVTATTTTAQWGAAGILAWKGHGVALVVFATILARMIAVAAYGARLSRLVPNLQLFSIRGLHKLPVLLRFGGWVSLSQLISPMLIYFDRVMIASFASLGAVTLYTVPYEAITRLRVIPSSVTATLYPAFSERGGEGRKSELARLYETAIRYLLILMLPAVLFILLFGRDLLSLWMGASFAAEASISLQILAIGALANSLAYVPYSALQALGRPDLTGKFHLVELPVYIVLCFLLIPRWGIAGAAVASTLRFTLDFAFLFWGAQRYCACSVRGVWKQSVPVLGAGVLLTTSMVGILTWCSTSWSRSVAGSVAVIAYFLASWWFVLNDREKPAIARAFGLYREQMVS